MWEEKGRIKQNSAIVGKTSNLMNRMYDDHTEDLHAWSIYRQNLNADLSECAIGVNKSANTERPFGNFQLKETTVNNILNHPKYGPRLKNQDPYNYLRFGLPRAKAYQNFVNTNENYTNKAAHASSMHNCGNGQVKTSKLNQMKKSNSQHSLSSDQEESTTAGISDLENVDLRTQNMNVNNRNASSNFQANHKSKLNNEQFNNRLVASNLTNTDYLMQEEHFHSNNYAQSAIKTHQNHHHNVLPQSSPCNELPVESKHLYNNLSNKHQVSSSSINRSNFAANTFMEHNPNLPSNINQPKFPHLIVRNLYYELDRTSNYRRVCGAQRQKIRIIDNVSFEVKAGEMLAIMATNELEGTSIMNVLANKHNKSRSRMKGDLIYDGVYLTPAKLGETLAYVGQNLELCNKMSTRQTILFATLLRSPARKRTFDTKKRIDAVLEELGLSEVRHTSVADLTNPERRRLLIAMCLMLDTDLLLLDQPTKEMDMFDTFFLIEYLRQWVVISGRCVILTIQPSTYEIFTLISKVALISTGRMLYFGARRDMLNYFSSIDFPCPAYKNPADYYLDLVTLDNLSTEAVLESSDRIETLVDLFKRRNTSNFIPPAPSLVSGTIRKQNFAIVFFALWIRSLIFMFPYNVIYMFRNLCLALILSLLTGSIFWHVRTGREQEFVWDRIMFYHCLIGIMPVPLFLIQMNDVYKEKQYVLNEIKIGLYSKGAYFVSNFIYSLPSSTLIFLAYAMPASSMAAQKHNIVFYLGIMLSYLHTIRIIALSVAWAFRKRSNAISCFAIIYLFIVITAGTSIHFKDLVMGIRLFQYATPFKWAHEALINWEFSIKDTLTRFLCTNNPIIQQENAILIKADCGFELNSHILIWFNYANKVTSTSTYFIAFALFSLVFLVFKIISFCLFARRKKSSVYNHRLLLRSSYK